MGTTVFVLYLYASSALLHTGGPTVIDNIYNEEACNKLALELLLNRQIDTAKCYPVKKMR